jgi:hypothetical protein
MRRSSETFSVGWTRWRGTFQSASNHIREDQIALGPQGDLAFQSATLYATHPLVVDFGQLSNDVLVFLRLLGRFTTELRLPGEVTLRMTMETGTKGALAIFQHGPASEEPMRQARFPEAKVVRTVRIDPQEMNRTPAALCTAAKRVIDRIANEFALEASPFGSGGKGFMAIAESSLHGMANRLFGA